MLLFPAGLHVVWALTKFTWLNQDERTIAVFFIFVSWYLGAIGGSLFGGALTPIWPKRAIYVSIFNRVLLFALDKINSFSFLQFQTLGAVLICFSSIFMLDDNDLMLITGRFIAGISHGMVYVAVIVHASENAVKEFREILILIIGGSINCSYILAAILFQPIDRVFLSESFLLFGSLVYAVVGTFLVLKYSIESVPFMVQHYCSENEALEMLAELQGKKMTHRTVYQDYLTIRNMCDDELMTYGQCSFFRLFSKGNYRPIIFCCYGRLISVLALNLPFVTMILIFLRDCIEDLMPDTGYATLVEDGTTTVPVTVATKALVEVERSFLAGLYNHEIQLVVVAWCGFGISTVTVLYLFDKKRLIYYTCSGLGVLLMFCGVSHSFFNILSTLMHLSLIAFFNYTTFAMDLFGHNFLAEAFPTTLKPVSIAYIMIIEHFLHIFIIFLYMVTWFHDRIIVVMVLVTILAFEIGHKMPRTNDMSIMAAAKEYHKINVRFIDTVVENYALRMV